MSKTDTRIITTHVPVSVTDWIANEEEGDRLTQEALADVDAGQVIDHQAVLAWADSLDADQSLLVPR